MRIQVLSDNKKMDNNLENEHGLCIYIETDNYKCLLDTGASGKFLQNAIQLGVDMEAIDFVFISHGHSDHIGGLMEFIEINTKATIILSKNALNQKFYSRRNGLKEISCEIDIEKLEKRLAFVKSETIFGNEVAVFPCQVQKSTLPKANKALYKKNNDNIVIDDFNHELIFCIGKDELVVYTGCAHNGLLNILDTVKQVTGKTISKVIGGFHLLDGIVNQYETENDINELADKLTSNYPNVRFYTGHCTGDIAYKLLKQKLNNNLFEFYTGFEVKN